MKRAVSLTCCNLFLVLAPMLTASEPRTWSLSTQADFLKGKLDGVSLTGDGRIIAAPAFAEKGNTSQAYIFSAASDRADNIYLGTGNEGKIFKFSREGKLSELAVLKEVVIYALATTADGRLYAGSSPDGKVYEISPDGKAREFFDPKEKYIWALAFDSQENLFVGTGPRGVIYRVNPAGVGTEFYDSSETHITALLVSGDELLAGSAPSGYIYRIDSKGKGFVLHDSSLSEVKALAVDRTGLIYAAAIAGGEVPGDSDDPKRPTPRSVRVLSGAASASSASADADAPAAPSPPRTEVRRSDVYRISKDGIVETILSSDEDLFYSLAVRNDGTVLVGSGKRGRIFSVDRNRAVTILVQASEEQVTALLEQGSRIVAATSNLGKVFELSPVSSTSGWFESDVFDARVSAMWGMIGWRVENPTDAVLEFYTRAGNTKLPDSTWSEWAGPYTNSAGEHVKSPRARFLQWKLQFSGNVRVAAILSTTNAVRQVAVSYLQQNVAPKITGITIHPPGIAFQQFQSGAASGPTLTGRSQARIGSPASRFAREAEPQSIRPAPRRIFQAGAQSISWDARDDNGDDLEYSLYFKGEGEAIWKLLESHLTDSTYTIDGRTLAEGTYTVRVVATDLPSNPADAAMTDEMVSRPFTITSSPPRIQVQSRDVKGNSVEIRFAAQSAVASLYAAEFSVDGGDWQIIYPSDGIADAPTEEFQFTAQAPPGEHIIGIRVTDSVGNVGTARVIFKM